MVRREARRVSTITAETSLRQAQMRNKSGMSEEQAPGQLFITLVPLLGRQEPEGPAAVAQAPDPGHGQNHHAGCQTGEECPNPQSVDQQVGGGFQSLQDRCTRAKELVDELVRSARGDLELEIAEEAEQEPRQADRKQRLPPLQCPGQVLRL